VPDRPPRVASDPRLIAFGRAVTKARTARGWTLDDLVEYSGLSRRTISYIEGGLVDPRLTTVLTLAAALGVKPGDLLN
jgi:transcriptional regulator with XRE-family HTH domain